jgi:peroxiredoxin/mono/diheme cytochrome c family protein
MSSRTFLPFLLLGLLLAFATAPLQSEPARSSEARPVASFALKDVRTDRPVSLEDLKDRKAVVLVFIGTECPVNNAFMPVLAGLSREYEARGVAFLGINANRQDAAKRVADHAKAHEIPFPVLKDDRNAVADRVGAKRTPEAIVLDGSRHIVYQGRIDDQFGIGYSRPGQPTRRDLAAALDELLAGKPVSVAKTDVAGCMIGREAKPKTEGAVTYAKQVSRILQQHCQECHRPGQIGPMPLLTYDDAASWADTIREVVSDSRMPPWHADPQFGKFANDRSLPKADREALLAWIDGGTPRGDDKDLPAPRAFVEGWRIGKPDMILEMKEAYKVPAETPEGGVPYQYFSVPTNFTEDRWIQFAEAKPGSPSVVHHMIAFIVPKGERFIPDKPGAVLTGTAPGDVAMRLPDGYAKLVPAGARLVFQMHYTPDGKPHDDVSRLGIIFAKEPPKHRVITRPVLNDKFVFRQDKIPAGDGNYRVEADYVFREDAHLVTMVPHMHLRGKDFVYEAIFPDGKKQTLLSVPHFQFGWQTLYRCAEPVAMPKGTKLHCVAHFDNSAKNPNNPDPKSDIYWGDQTWEEMMVGWIDYYLDAKKP